MALRRKIGALPGILMIVLVAAACDKPAPEPQILIRPVRAQQVFFSGGERTRVFSGVAQAGQQIDLSFKVAGSVQRVAVKMGDRVKAGDLVAELDPKDILLEMEEADAALARQRADARNAAANYARIEALYEANNASLAELDAARAQNETAQAAVRSAEKALQLARRKAQYTRLTAPVAGAIAAKLISENENVQAGQTILRLNSGSQPEVQVTIPEVLIAQIETGDAVEVRFDALPGRSFAAKVREVGVAATGGASFPVTVRLKENQKETRPGMAAEVAFVFAAKGDRPRILAPAKAIGEDIHGKFAFVVLPSENDLATAKRVTVVTGALTAEGLEIIEGLGDGDYLVTAGVHKLIDGQRVKFSPPLTEDKGR
jgi:membrane fusion protein, multidrug efflux system